MTEEQFVIEYKKIPFTMVKLTPDENTILINFINKFIKQAKQEERTKIISEIENCTWWNNNLDKYCTNCRDRWHKLEELKQ